MSTTYGIYNLSTKQWINLGKSITSEKKFQVSSHRIIEFLYNSKNCNLAIVGDDRNTMDEEGGWEEIGDLWDD